MSMSLSILSPKTNLLMTNLWKNDEELFSIARQELFTALVGDVLDKMGYLHQFLPPHIKPLSLIHI